MDEVRLRQVLIDATATPAMPVYVMTEEDEAALAAAAAAAGAAGAAGGGGAGGAGGAAAPAPAGAHVARRRENIIDDGGDPDDEEEEVRLYITVLFKHGPSHVLKSCEIFEKRGSKVSFSSAFLVVRVHISNKPRGVHV